MCHFEPVFISENLKKIKAYSPDFIIYKYVNLHLRTWYVICDT